MIIVVLINMDFWISIYRVSNLTWALVNQPPVEATWTTRYLESEQEQRNSGWWWSAPMPNKRISQHRDTISCHQLCCTNDLIDMKGRCCLKIAVSIPQRLFTSGQPQHMWGILPKTALPLWWKVVFKKGSWHHSSQQMMNKWRITSMMVW